MKKYLFFLVALFSLFVTTSSVSAEEGLKISSTKELHDVIIENNLAELDAYGKLIVNLREIKEFNVSTEILEEYLADLKKINLAVEKEFIYIDSTLAIQSYSPMEISNSVFEDGLISSKNSLSMYSTTPGTGDGGAGLPTINVKSLVMKNRAELEDIYDLMWTTQLYGGGDAWTATVGWWVGKVMPGGSWDYKSVSGYSPWYKDWFATFFNNRIQLINSAYLGNYNYGYTGELLFNKATLLAAGDGVSIITSLIDNAKRGEFKASLDGEDDKIPVRAGFDDAVLYE